jgi:hypothetical protein
MNLEKKDDLDHSTCRPKSVEEAVGSHFALQVALQTMKERCQHLQQRLTAVEEENLRLRIENRRRRSDSAGTVLADTLTNESEGSKTRMEGLEEKVAMLTRQKSQLTHHLFMVATENRQLWNRLSCLTQANQSLGNHLSKISSTLSRHHSTNSITIPKSDSPISSLLHRGELNLSSNHVLTEESDNIAKKGIDTECDSAKEHRNLYARTSHGIDDKGLEEISLKLIKSFLQEKTELEEQYEQMVAIQSDLSVCNIQNLGFTCLEDGSEAIEDLKEHHRKLLELRDMLKQQQTMMKAAVANVERLKKVSGPAVCSHCQEKSGAKRPLSDTDMEMEAEIESLRKWGIPDSTSYSEDILRQLDLVAEPPETTDGIITSREHREQICPMCGKIYSHEIPFRTFQQHVSDHFVEEEPVSCVKDNFEFI